MVNFILSLLIIGSSNINTLADKEVEISFSMDVLDRKDYSFPEAMWLNNVGEPNLPSLLYKIGIPQDGGVEVTIVENREEVIRDITIDPVKHLGIYEPPFPDSIKIYDDVYKEDRFFPLDVIEVSKSAYYRDIYTVEVRLNPIRYNPVSRTLRVSSYIKVNIRFRGKPIDKPIVDTSFEEIYKRTIVNYEQCKTWRREPKAGLGNPFSSGVWFKIEVGEEGLYLIGYSEIMNAGLDPGQFDPRTMKIYTAAFDLLPIEGVVTPFADSLVEIPVYVQGEDDHIFDSDDYLIFYGFPASHFIPDSAVGWFENGYAHNNVYWFTFGGEYGERMEKVNAAWNGETADTVVNEIAHFEEDKSNPTRSGTNWFWEDASPAGTEPGYHSFLINHPKAQGNAQISVGIFTLDFGTRIYQCDLDGEVFFHDTLLVPVQAHMPPNYLTGNGMLLSDSSIFNFHVYSFPDGGRVYFNSVDMQYERLADLGQPFHAFYGNQENYTIKCTDVGSAPFVLDITDMKTPKMFYDYSIEGNSMLLTSSTDSFQLLYFSKRSLTKSADLIPANPGNLRTQSPGCEYLFITHEDFYNAIMPLVDYRRREYSTKLVTINDVFDDFAFGKYDPLAIKNFLYYTTNNWTTIPKYVLLVGDATYDYKNNLGKEDPPNFIPMYERGTTLSGNPGIPPNYIYDGEYVNFGAGEVMALGRITVRTTKETRDVIDKLLTYETTDIDGMWNKRIILAGDDEYATSWEGPDDHCGACEDNISYIPDLLYDFAKIYMISYKPFPPHQVGTVKISAREAFIRELNKGCYAGVYYGHGNARQLAHEVLFASSHIPRVRNNRKYFFFYFGSCTVGRFDDGDNECIAEEFVRIKDGAIGTLGATAGSSSGPNRTIGQRLFNCLTDPDTNLTMGECCLIAKSNYWYIHYLLLGDPATKLRKPETPMGIKIDSTVLHDTVLFGDTIKYIKPLERLRIIADQDRYYLKAFVRDADTISIFDDATADDIAGYVYRLVQDSNTNNPHYVGFGYEIDGKEIYQGFWDDDTAIIIVPRIATDQHPVIKLSSFCNKNSGVLDSIKVLGNTATVVNDGPEIVLYDRGRKLKDGDWVDKEFLLTGKVSDEDGINLLNWVGNISRGFYLYVNERDTIIDLRDYFHYDRNSSTTGEFNFDIVLPKPVDTLTINVTDNYFNQTVKTIVLNAEISGEVSIEDFLIYPNPLQDESGIWFTFIISRSGLVSIKIFTIAGRLIKTIDNVHCSAGYNQIYWDTFDDFHDEISNGVYLINASVETSDSKDEIIERFIIAR